MNLHATDLLLHRFDAFADHELVVDMDGRRLTYADIRSIAEKLADGWRREGLKDGDHVALALANGVEMICAYFACFFGGFVAVPVNRELSPDDVNYILAASAPKLVLRDGLDLPKPGSPVGDETARGRADETSAIFVTSGTTGNPKGAMHSLNSLAADVASLNAMLRLGPETRMYHFLPMAYMAGFVNTVLMPAMAGGTVVLGNRFTPQTALDFWTPAARGNANTMWITPSIAAALVRLTRDAERAKANAGRFGQTICATAPLHDAVRDGFHETFGVPLQESYGTSELLLLTAQSRADAEARRDVGFPLPEFDFIFVDDGEGGTEIGIRTPYRYLGYLTADGVVPVETYGDGYVMTGDAGRMVDGRLQITGRLKELIIRGGVNISPIAIENVIGAVPGVVDVAVVGMPHPFWGESIVACIEAGDGADRAVLTAAVRERCRERLSKASQPDRIDFVGSFPRTATGKVRKRLLQRDLSD